MVSEQRRPPQGLRIQGLSGQWGNFQLHPVSLEVHPGGYLVLLGPSGCGKTTLVELLCGLRRPRTGQVFLGENEITHADPADRLVGYVPQDYELFPTRTVQRNIFFAPSIKKQRGKEIETRLARTIEMLHLEALLHRNVQTLSGGERQRVALARALMTDPDILLLDEPVSALPETLRDKVCRELKSLLTTLGITTVHVSHNLGEALELADRMAIMDVGRIVQVAPPEEVMDRPVNRFVAEFTQCRNIWSAEVRAGRLYIEGQSLGPSNAGEGRYWAAVRPERLNVQPGGQAEGELAGRVVESARASHGHFTKVDLGAFSAWVCDHGPRTEGLPVALSLPEEAIWLMPR